MPMKMLWLMVLFVVLDRVLDEGVDEYKKENLGEGGWVRGKEGKRGGVRTSVFPISGSWEAPVIQYSIDEA